MYIVRVYIINKQFKYYEHLIPRALELGIQFKYYEHTVQIPKTYCIKFYSIYTMLVLCGVTKDDSKI